MATETFELEAVARERVGKGAARQVRREGRVPAVIYGGKQEPESISLNYNDVWRMYIKGQFMAKVITLKVDGKEHLVVSRDVQVHPVKDTPVHIDFLRIAKGDRVRVHIPVKFKNEASCPGLKRGGVLNIVRHDVEVWSPPASIPDVFEIDLAKVEIGESIHVSAIAMAEGVAPVIEDRDFTIATIVGRGPAGGADEEDAEGGGEAAAAKDKDGN
ncbi:MAG: 50S ribosomal protein L25/general stress protein Ctc [Alphaproteobacteria bacterium]|nr:50S ribosomal protein L25/general stress protein Ctc [Alphaproteobacteria bacterium]